jgi:hypothetical protein
MQTKTNLVLALLGAGALLPLGAAAGAASPEEGVALAIVYDTSGSMKELVPDRAGGRSPKYVIANRALETIANQLQAFASGPASAGPPRKIETALIIFDNGRPRVALPLRAFKAAALRDWARRFASPSGGTPLGNALRTAGQAVLRSPLTRKHVLVITDGLNTVGPAPERVMPDLKREAAAQQTSLEMHFIAFDVDAKQFEPLKKLGATVVGAADEKQLSSQLDYILQRKILLEAEEPPKK